MWWRHRSLPTSRLTPMTGTRVTADSCLRGPALLGSALQGSAPSAGPGLGDPPLPSASPPRPASSAKFRPFFSACGAWSASALPESSVQEVGVWFPSCPRHLGHGGPQEEGLRLPGQHKFLRGRCQANPFRRVHRREVQDSVEGPTGRQAR